MFGPGSWPRDSLKIPLKYPPIAKRLCVDALARARFVADIAPDKPKKALGNKIGQREARRTEGARTVAQKTDIQEKTPVIS